MIWEMLASLVDTVAGMFSPERRRSRAGTERTDDADEHGDGD